MSQATQPVSTAAALRAGERSFERRGVWLVLLLGLVAAAGPLSLSAHIFGAGDASLLTAAIFSGVFLGMLLIEKVHGQLAQQVQDLLRLGAWHDAAVAAELVDPKIKITATIRIRSQKPVPRIRARALASLMLTPRLLPRPTATRAHARS